MVTRVVNLYKEKFDVYIGRQGHGKDGYFGNPFPLTDPNDQKERAACLLDYRDYFYKRITEDIEFQDRIHELRGKTLGCFCKPKLCHGDIIVEYLEKVSLGL